MNNKHNSDKEKITPNQDSLKANEEYFKEIEEAYLERDFEILVESLRYTIDKCQDARIILKYADALTDYEQKIKYYTNFLQKKNGINPFSYL